MDFQAGGHLRPRSHVRASEPGQFAYRLTDRSGVPAARSTCGGMPVPTGMPTTKKAAYRRNANPRRSASIAGFSAGAGAAFGFDGRGFGTAEHLKEWAFTFDLNYVKPDGPPKGVRQAALHRIPQRSVRPSRAGAHTGTPSVRTRSQAAYRFLFRCEPCNPEKAAALPNRPLPGTRRTGIR